MLGKSAHNADSDELICTQVVIRLAIEALEHIRDGEGDSMSKVGYSYKVLLSELIKNNWSIFCDTTPSRVKAEQPAKPAKKRDEKEAAPKHRIFTWLS